MHREEGAGGVVPPFLALEHHKHAKRERRVFLASMSQSMGEAAALVVVDVASRFRRQPFLHFRAAVPSTENTYSESPPFGSFS